MLDQYNIQGILFLDIETVPQSPAYDTLPDNMKRLWDRKSEQLSRIDKFRTESVKQPSELYERAGIYAEFGRIVCISTGVLRNGVLWIKSYSGKDEKQLLTSFSEVLNKAAGKGITQLCAHNGKEFDYPYMIRRMLINRLPVPSMLDIAGKKPWEVNHLDTLELWKFGDFKSYTSLELLATVFGIPTPKDDIDGSDVGRVFWEEDDLPRIVTYCQKDVVTMVNLFLRFQGKELMGEENISYM